MFANRVRITVLACALFICAAGSGADQGEKPAVERAPAPRLAPKKFAFRFKAAKWDAVLDAYAQITGLTCITSVKPKGTFTFDPPPERTSRAEIEDIIDEALEPQELVLVARRLTFSVVPLDELRDGRGLTAVADLHNLPKRFHTTVAIPLGILNTADAEVAVRRLLGSRGSVEVLRGTNAVLVSDSVTNLRLIAPLIRAAEVQKLAGSGKPAEKTVVVEFKNAKGKEVAAWYAWASGLKCDTRALPDGPFTVRAAGDKRVTLGEATDLINEQLLREGFYLIRGTTTFVVVKFWEKIDPGIVPAVAFTELTMRGRTELVEVAIPLHSELNEEDASELKKLLTSVGVFLFAQGKWLVVRDTVESVLRIAKLLGELE